MNTKEIEPNSVIEFKGTLCPSIEAPVRMGVLLKYNKKPYWQSLFQSHHRTTRHHRVNTAMVQDINGTIMKIDTRCIIGSIQH